MASQANPKEMEQKRPLEQQLEKGINLSLGPEKKKQCPLIVKNLDLDLDFV